MNKEFCPWCEKEVIPQRGLYLPQCPICYRDITTEMVVRCALCDDKKIYKTKNNRPCPYRRTHDWRPVRKELGGKAINHDNNTLQKMRQGNPDKHMPEL